jgi:DNA-binding CsgD family transcriptional regulator
MIKLTTLKADREILLLLESGLDPKVVAYRLQITTWRVYHARRRRKGKLPKPAKKKQ